MHSCLTLSISLLYLTPLLPLLISPMQPLGLDGMIVTVLSPTTPFLPSPLTFLSLQIRYSFTILYHLIDCYVYILTIFGYLSSSFIRGSPLVFRNLGMCISLSTYSQATQDVLRVL